MKKLALAAVVFGCITLAVSAGDPPQSPSDGSKEPTPADYTALSQIIQKFIIKEIPKEFSENSEWGMTVPIPPKLRLPNLRTRVRVGDHEELPHGLWKRGRLWFDDPAKDVTIQVRELKPLENGKGHRLGMDVTAKVHAVREWQHWQKGLATVGASAQARATVTIALDFDVAVSLDGKKLPPDLKVEPKVVDSKITLKDFELQKISPIFGFGASIEGERARELGNEVKGLIQSILTSREPELREEANRAIAQALREGKGNISADTLFKSLGSKNAP